MHLICQFRLFLISGANEAHGTSLQLLLFPEWSVYRRYSSARRVLTTLLEGPLVTVIVN